VANGPPALFALLVWRRGICASKLCKLRPSRNVVNFNCRNFKIDRRRKARSVYLWAGKIITDEYTQDPAATS